MFQFLQSESSANTADADSSESSVKEVHVESGKAEPVTKDEVVSFPTNCSHCNSPTETRMKLVGILLIFYPPCHNVSCALLFL